MKNRFILLDNEKGQFHVPVRDNLLKPERDGMFITDIVDELNYSNELCSQLWEENRRLRLSNKILRANRKDCEKGRISERKSFNKFDEYRLNQIRELHQIVKEEYMKRIKLEKENKQLKKSNKSLGEMLAGELKYGS